MGLEQHEAGNYITILGGKFCQRVKEGTEGAIQRTNKLGKVVWEKFYDSFTAKLVGIKTQDGEYGKSWVFSFKDKDEVYHLQLGYSNSFSTAFLKMLPNLDLSKEMKIQPDTKEVDGKKKSSLFIKQDGVNIKHAFTREAPNGMPDMEEIIVKGMKTWDDTKRLVFLHNMVVTTILPKLGATSIEEPKSDADKAFDDLGTPTEAVKPEDQPF
jgi:hypothetical protein